MATEVLLVSPLFRLKKDLKGLLVVHPAWYIKALITVVKPFIRSATHTSLFTLVTIATILMLQASISR